MIDLHCHLLPGVDDGAQTLDEAIALARHAVADGIRTACLTPHFHAGRYPANTFTAVQQATRAFQDTLNTHQIPLTVRAGGEVRLSIELLDLIAQDQVPFLGTVNGYRIVLLEFPHQNIPIGADRLISKLFSLGMRPLIAHPERNTAVMAQPEKIFPFVAQGCWLQITAGSLAGRFGPRAAEVALHLVDNGWATVIATDAHDLVHRPPALSEGIAALRAKRGDEVAHRLGVDNPRLIAEGGNP